jgi:hypothetical protein
VRALAQELGVTPPTASDAIASLLAKKLVSKARDPSDGRAVLVQLTPAGVRTAAEAARWPELFSVALGALAAEEKVAMLRAVTSLMRALQEMGAIHVSRTCVTCRHFAADVHDGARPHHCHFVDAPFGDGELRTNCPEHASLTG